MSQRVLLALTQAGVSREDAYRLVQRNAMKVWEQGKDFKTELLGDEDVLAALSTEQITEKFDLNYHTKHVDTIFTRVFGDGWSSPAKLRYPRLAASMRWDGDGNPLLPQKHKVLREFILGNPEVSNQSKIMKEKELTLTLILLVKFRE